MHAIHAIHGAFMVSDMRPSHRYWVLHGVSTVRTVSWYGFFKQQEVEHQISFFSTHVAFLNAAVIGMAVATKLSVCDSVKVRQLGALVRDLNPHHIVVDLPGMSPPMRIHDLLGLLETKVQESAR